MPEDALAYLQQSHNTQWIPANLSESPHQLGCHQCAYLSKHPRIGADSCQSDYLTIYFQACKGSSPQQSGIDTLAFSFVLGPFVFLTGVSVSLWNLYRPQAYIGWVFNIVSVALLSSLTSDSLLSLAIGYSVLLSIGGGIVSSVTQFPVLAPLATSDAPHGWAFMIFCRSFAAVSANFEVGDNSYRPQVWGVAIGGTILQNQLAARLPSEFLRLVQGVDIAYSAIPLIPTLDDPLHGQVTEAFWSALSVLWKVLAGIAGAGLLSALLMKDVPMHETVDKTQEVEPSDEVKRNPEVA